MKIRVKGSNPVGVTIRCRNKSGDTYSKTFSVYDVLPEALFDYLVKHLGDAVELK